MTTAAQVLRDAAALIQREGWRPPAHRQPPDWGYTTQSAILTVADPLSVASRKAIIALSNHVGGDTTDWECALGRMPADIDAALHAAADSLDGGAA